MHILWIKWCWVLSLLFCWTFRASVVGLFINSLLTDCVFWLSEASVNIFFLYKCPSQAEDFPSAHWRDAHGMAELLLPRRHLCGTTECQDGWPLGGRDSLRSVCPFSSTPWNCSPQGTPGSEFSAGWFYTAPDRWENDLFCQQLSGHPHTSHHSHWLPALDWILCLPFCFLLTVHFLSFFVPVIKCGFAYTKKKLSRLKTMNSIA